MGTVDATGMVTGAAGAKQPHNSNSMQKALRVHVTSMGGSVAVSQPRVYCDPSVVGWTLFMNGHHVQATYDATKRTTYVQPVSTTTAVPNAVPVSDPAVANFGIGGSLTGSLAAPGFTDFLYIQLRSATPATGFTSPCFFGYDESG